MPNFKLLILITFLFIANSAHSEDLFDNNLARDYKSTSTIKADSTIGGYPIFQGGRVWRVLSGKTTSNNINLKLANIQLISPIANEYFAEIHLMVNLENHSSYYTSDVCNGSHLYKLNKGGGQYDNCLTINPYMARIRGNNVNTLRINVRNSQQGARIYDLNLLLSLSQLGFPRTEIQDWTENVVSQDIEKKKLLGKVTDWAKKLQDGVNKAIEYSKPLNAFSEVPPINSLIPVINMMAPDSEIAIDKNVGNTTLQNKTSESPAIVGKTLLQRLSELKELLDKGLITKNQYEKRSGEILQEF